MTALYLRETKGNESSAFKPSKDSFVEQEVPLSRENGQHSRETGPFNEGLSPQHGSPAWEGLPASGGFRPSGYAGRDRAGERRVCVERDVGSSDAKHLCWTLEGPVKTASFIHSTIVKMGGRLQAEFHSSPRVTE